MDQINSFADDRLLTGCVYCGGPAETRDHVPSKCLLELPYPENLPVVGACQTCNQGSSLDEEYLICLIESVICGSNDPDKMNRPSVARAMRRSTALRALIESTRTVEGDHIQYTADVQRVAAVMLKLARGHAAFELSQSCREAPDRIWFGPLQTMSEDEREAFEAAPAQDVLGEVGSRGMQRMMIAQVVLESESGKRIEQRLIVNDWVDVQDDVYRYLAIIGHDGVIIRMVVAEYLGCEVFWKSR